MAFFIGWGSWGKKLKDKGGGSFFCPNCSEIKKFKRKELTKYAQIFFVPVYSSGTGEAYIECNACKQMFDESVTSNQQIEEDNPTDELWKLALVLVKVARASGEVSLEQITNIRGACFGQTGEYLTREQAEEIEDSLVEWSEGDIPPFSTLLSQIIHTQTTDEKRELMETAIAVAMLDKKLTAAERDMLNELKDVLDIEISY